MEASSSVQRLETPPSEGGTYIIPKLRGEALTIPGSKGVFRIVASSKQTSGRMAVFTSDAVLADAPGFHYHNEAHDVFLVTKGFLKLWAGEDCRILGPGDFASVPPKYIHNPHGLGPITQLCGLITPGDWVDFFRHVSEPYKGLIVPEHDDRNLKEIILPKVMAAKGKFDVVFQPQHKGCEVKEWSANDEQIPDSATPYFLRANTGPRWMLGGVISRPFMTTVQSGGTSAITSIESSSAYGETVFSKFLSFDKIYHCFVVLEGVLGVKLRSVAEKTVVHEGDTIIVAAGEEFSLSFDSLYVRVWSFASGDGIESIVHKAGEPYAGMVLPDEAPSFDKAKVDSVCSSLGAKIKA